eukprot:767734-Hanusia_phi.AAC.12
MHPQRLEREEKRDEALVRQAKRQVEEDQRMLKEARTVSNHDEKMLVKVAVARKSLQMDDGSSRKQKAINNLKVKASVEAKRDGALLHDWHIDEAGHVVQTQITPARSKVIGVERKSIATEWQHTRARSNIAEQAMNQRGDMSARFESVHRKAVALRNLGKKHNEIFVDQADRKAHHTVEVLPYLLPPIGIAVLVVLGASTYMVKKWQKIPSGMFPMRSSFPVQLGFPFYHVYCLRAHGLTDFSGISIVRRQNVDDLKAGFSKFAGKKEEVQWQELEHSAL